MSFPAEYYKADFIVSGWTDHLRDNMRLAGRILLSGTWEYTNELKQLSHKKLLEYMLVCLYGEKVKEQAPLTGARFVRFTNVTSGYPVYRIDAFRKSPDSPETPLYTGVCGKEC